VDNPSIEGDVAVANPSQESRLFSIQESNIQCLVEIDLNASFRHLRKELGGAGVSEQVVVQEYETAPVSLKKVVKAVNLADAFLFERHHTEPASKGAPPGQKPYGSISELGIEDIVRKRVLDGA